MGSRVARQSNRYISVRPRGRPRDDQGGGGAIVTMASGRALAGAANGAHYSATKGGIISLTKSLALDWAAYGIRVNCVIPGISDTAQPRAEMSDDQLYAAGARIPLGRIGQPEDIAGVVAFLLGSDAAYMTGQSVAVNGGAIMISMTRCQLRSNGMTFEPNSSMPGSIGLKRVMMQSMPISR